MRRIAIALALILVVLTISGCTQAPTQAQGPAKYERNVIICPNPDCPLHDPNGRVRSAVDGYNGRPIDMEYNGGAGTHFLCQVCGEQWSM